MKIYAALLACALSLAPLHALAQAPAPPREQDEETVRVASGEVAVDVVVKDKKDRPVKDLTASDFEVYEDGVRQQLQSFRLFARGAVAEAPAEAAKDGASPARPAAPRPGAPPPGVVAIVFDRLSPEARARAAKAALGYVGTGPGGGDFIGVFVIDQSLRAYQPFTSDRQLVRRALERAAALSPSGYTSETEEVRRLSERQESLARETAASGTEQRDAVGIAEQALNQMTMRTLETYELLEREQQGYATTNGLLSVVNAMGRVEGRKALIFLSEGLAVPTAVQDYFRSVIGNANRAGVSIYAVDAAGLRVDGPTAETRRELQAIGARRQRQSASGVEDTSGQPMSRVMERNEDVLRLNPESGLGQLADQTGGLLISGTNDIASKLRQVDEDLRAYYVLSYTPRNQNYDGRFRRIEVKLNRGGHEVQARKGYYAINASDASPVLAYEAPALAALGGANKPSAFLVHAGAYNFPEAARPDLVAVVAEIPHAQINYAQDPEKKIYRSDFSVVALVRDESRQVVRTLSRQYLSAVPAEQLEAAKRGLTLFYRETDLPTGRYTVDVAVYDAVADKSGLSSETLEVSGGGKLRLGSLAVLKRAEKLSPDERKQSNPFHYGEVIVYPNLGEPLRKASDQQLAFFLTAYTAAPTSAPPKLTLEIKQGGRTLSRAQLELPPPDASGRIQYANALPIDKLQPGEYELTATAADGVATVSRSTRFVIQ